MRMRRITALHTTTWKKSMLGPHWLRLGLFLSLLWIGAAAQTPPAENKDALDFSRLAEIFALPGDSQIQGELWVAVDTGPANWPEDREGWLIEEGPKELLLLDWYGEIHKLRKPAPNENRPKLKEEKDGAILWSPEADYSVAWKVRKEDYNAKSQKFLKGGLPQDKKDEGVFRFVNQRFGLAGHIVDSTRYAHYAYQFDKKEHAKELYAHALKAYKKYADSYLGGLEQSEELHIFVANTIASRDRHWAISSAHGGIPRKELQEQWEKIAAIPYHEYRGEANMMAEHYRTLQKEDDRWAEPDAKTFEKFTTEQKVAYWLYHLRDLDIGQASSPGQCNIFDEYNRGHRDGIDERPNAAKELKKLGIAAVPLLIKHLDDARPTRCKGHWRSYWPEGHYLLRYGDCYQQIFESITGHTLFRGTTTVSYPIHDGAGKQCQEKAETWWRENHQQKPNAAK